ncbi:hypothetical protein [Larkinella punicea]|uniref:Outer membrane protein beta-barrel domain-containing protein n=1 Tax=Larkinella punicea TaxID=2315727 RepID=A0A368JHA6_9BACT|nr:hypothetical protein [Larkinella punicea]RCR65481.1 hypothetical protein DUE52_31725 [Larkinella punicea]
MRNFSYFGLKIGSISWKGAWLGWWFLMVPVMVIAQPGHWRVGLQLGVAHTRSKLTATPAIPDNQFTFTTPTGTWWQANLERSMTSHLSLKVGMGRMRLPYSMSHHIALRDASGRVTLMSGGSSGGGDAFSYASLGLIANTRAWGPVIVTAGLDLQGRYNRRAKSTFVYGGYGSSRVIRGPDTLRLFTSNRFTPQPTAIFTLALAPQLGVDVRLSQRLFLGVVATYNLGLGYIRQATSPIQINNERYESRFTHSGSFMGYRAGLKYSIGKVKSLGTLHYTAYNQPQPQASWYEPERARTFRRKSWLTGGRMGYFSERSSRQYELSFQGYGGYFIFNQVAVGLKGKYNRDYRFTTFPIIRSWLLGPMVRLYATNSRIAPFVEGSYQMGKVHFDLRTTPFPYPAVERGIDVLSLGAGVSARLSDQFRLDLMAETQKFSNYPLSRASAVRPELGVTYFIRK